MAEVCSFKRITTSGIVGDSGAPIDVAGYVVTSGGGGAAAPTFMNGTSASAPAAFTAANTATSTTTIQSIPLPVRLPLGCFVSFDANTSVVTAFFIQAIT